MEKFYFEIPSMNRKDEIIEFLDEFVNYKSEINGTGGLDKIYEGLTFEEALDRCLNLQNDEYAESINRATSKTFLLIRENDNKIVGTINIRWKFPKDIEMICTHIGYCIRPTERRKGYNKINLYLGLIEAQKLGLEKVILDCYSDNVGSYKTIEALGGILESEEIDPYDGMLTRIYSIDVNECIAKNKEKYNNYI